MWIPMFAGFVLGLTATATAEEPAAVPAPARDYVDYLVDQLRFAKDDDDREDAAEELGKIGDPRAIPALEQAAIYDDEDDVRDESRKALKRIYKLHPAPVAVAPAPVVAPAPQPVVATPAPQPVVVTPAPVAVAPAPVVVAPAPVVVAPAYPVVVRRYYAPAPVVVAPAPVRSFGFSFGFAYRGHGGHHGHHGHH
jgi:hypothetical protein